LSVKQQGLVSPRQQPVVRPVVTSATIQRKPKKEDTASSHGKKKQPKTIPNEFQPVILKVITKMNELAGTAYKPESKIVLDGLLGRLKSGATEKDCLAVVEDRWRNWSVKPDMRQHFNPETLFRDKNFEKYRNAVRMNGTGSSSAEVRFVG
jgi:uncharacterized phage protein (TIGR02220 family)